MALSGDQRYEQWWSEIESNWGAEIYWASERNRSDQRYISWLDQVAFPTDGIRLLRTCKFGNETCVKLRETM